MGDLIDEADAETFTVVLSTPVNANIDSGTGTGRIDDDDDAPAISIADVSQAEGNAATSNMVFTVSLSAPSSKQIKVSAATSLVPGGATAPSDFTMKGPLVLTFNPGQTSMTFTVAIKGNALPEPDETFAVVLSSEVNATIARGTATGTIQNDDPGTPVADPVE